MPNKWITALKQWNGEKGGPWCVPRKGSPEYDAVRGIMDGRETPARKAQREKGNEDRMAKALQQLRGVEAETKERNVKRKAEAQKVSKKPTKVKVKVDSLAAYKKGYTGSFQDYTDSRDEEVIYPTKDVKEIIELAYKNNTPKEIQKSVGYNLLETATMIYDHFISRNMENPKEYKYEDEVMKIMREG
jgi:hypothetical protein